MHDPFDQQGTDKIKSNTSILKRSYKYFWKVAIAIILFICVFTGIFLLKNIQYDNMARQEYSKGIQLFKTDQTSSYTKTLNYFKSFSARFPRGEFHEKAIDITNKIEQYQYYGQQLSENEDAGLYSNFKTYINWAEVYINYVQEIDSLVIEITHLGNNDALKDLVSLFVTNLSEYDAMLVVIDKIKNAPDENYGSYMSNEEINLVTDVISCGYNPGAIIYNSIYDKKDISSQETEIINIASKKYRRDLSTALFILKDKRFLITEHDKQLEDFKNSREILIHTFETYKAEVVY